MADATTSSSSSSDLLLYTYWRSSCSWRVRFVLSWKGLSYQSHTLSLLKGDQNSAENKAINPMQTVPTLKHGSLYFNQSLAIAEYLEEVFPQTRHILPSDPVSRARVRAACLHIVADTQPLQNLRILQEIESLTHDAKTKTAWAIKWIENGLTAFQSSIESLHGKYCLGDEVTLADFCLFPQLYNARRFNIDLSKYKLLTDIENHFMTEHAKEWKEAHPDSQPDNPDLNKSS